MTVEEVIREMQGWPARDVLQVFDAFSLQQPNSDKGSIRLSPAMAEHFRKVRELGAQSGVSYTDAEVVEAVRRSRG